MKSTASLTDRPTQTKRNTSDIEEAQPATYSKLPHHGSTTSFPPALSSSIMRCASAISSSLKVFATETCSEPASICSASSCRGVCMDSSDPPEYAVRQTELGMLPMGAKVGRVQPGKCEQVFVVWDSPVSWAGTVSHNPRHANSAMRFHALQRIKQRRRSRPVRALCPRPHHQSLP